MLFIFLFHHLICTQRMLKLSVIRWFLTGHCSLWDLSRIHLSQKCIDMKYFFCVNRNAYGLFVNSICKCMKIIKILHSICFSNICLILRVAITASSFFCIARDRCLKGQSDYLLTLCLYSGGEYFGSTS